MSTILYATPHMVVSGNIVRGYNSESAEYQKWNASDGIVHMLITLQVNGKISNLEFWGDFHEGFPTQRAIEDWTSMYETLQSIGYEFDVGEYGSTGESTLTRLYAQIEYHEVPPLR